MDHERVLRAAGVRGCRGDAAIPRCGLHAAVVLRKFLAALRRIGRNGGTTTSSGATGSAPCGKDDGADGAKYRKNGCRFSAMKSARIRHIGGRDVRGFDIRIKVVHSRPDVVLAHSRRAVPPCSGAQAGFPVRKRRKMVAGVFKAVHTVRVVVKPGEDHRAAGLQLAVVQNP